MSVRLVESSGKAREQATPHSRVVDTQKRPLDFSRHLGYTCRDPPNAGGGRLAGRPPLPPPADQPQSDQPPEDEIADHDLIQQVQSGLIAQHQSTTRTAANGERWLDCRCPLHADAHRSASFSLDKGTFTCRVCSPGSSLPLTQVAAALLVPIPPLPPPNGSQPAPSLKTPDIETARWCYSYYWPNGELSHHHWRIQLSSFNPSTGKPNKRYLFQTADGEWHRPGTYYPLYGDLGIPASSHLIVTEGEPATDIVNAFDLQLNDQPIHALTAGSTSDLLANGTVEVLTARLQELQPATITLWPDADEPGVKAMRELQKQLAQRHLAVNVLKPADLKLDNKADAVEFLQGGGDLPAVLAVLHKPSALLQPRDIADRLIVTSEGVLWPGTERIWRLDQSTCSSLWQRVTGRMPTDRDAKELLNLLRGRQSEEPTPVYWRTYIEPNRVIWRPDSGQDCYEITAQGVASVVDAPAGLLMAPGKSVVPASADPHGTQEHYHKLCEFFGLSQLERALILAWLICCLLGRETPILLMRGLAGTGKSTLAGFLLGLVEPTLREMDLEGQRNFTDHRQLLQTLRQVPALLIDNLTAMSAGMEDVLSRLVTGYSSSVMWKYSNEVEQLRLRRGIIITTTNYDVYKGDLASRIIVCQPRITGGWVDRDDEINPLIMPLLPMIRGWLFRQAHKVLATPPSKDSSFRVASIGRVLAALGYDAKSLAEQEGREKARMLNQNDPWMQALVDIWERENQGGEFLLSLGQIVDRMYDLGVPRDALPTVGSSRFPRWAEEKHMLLRDHGFYLERYRDAEKRGYWFRRVKV